jgi:hypothetical protein
MVGAKCWDRITEGYSISNTGKDTKVGRCMLDDKDYKGVNSAVVRKSGNNVQMTPLTTPFTLSIQSQGYQSHFSPLTILH